MPYGVVNIGNRGQRFGIGKIGFAAGKAQEASLQHIEGNIALRFEQLCQLAALAAQRLRLKQLGDAFMQPGRAASGGKLIDEGMREFMLQNPAPVLKSWN